jgi:hypothetical protein
MLPLGCLNKNFLEAVVQRQIEYYNTQDLKGFASSYADDGVSSSQRSYYKPVGDWPYLYTLFFVTVMETSSHVSCK